MIRVEQIKLPLSYTDATLRAAVADRLGVPSSAVREVKLLRRSVDARRKPAIGYVATVAADAGGVERELTARGKAAAYAPSARTLRELNIPPCASSAVVVGSGPAGMFASLALARAGVKVTVIERGSRVDERTRKIDGLRSGGILDPECNVQYGEGGAGTYSDGKLNTGTSSEMIAVVLGELVEHGAPPEIEYLAKPHIGTDKLRAVVANFRSEIERAGGRYLFDTRVTDIKVRGGALEGLVLEGAHAGVLETQAAFFAIGHSARDTYRMLDARGVELCSKAFSVGVRIEHLQGSINRAQYGSDRVPFAADYKLATHLDGGRGVYTFCMCPGGEVVCSSSESGGIVTNGMSEYARAGQNANAAVLVGVDAKDYGEGLFDGLEFQRHLERAAFELSQSYSAPVQRWEDFAARRATRAFGEVLPTYLPAPVPADLHACLPPFVTDALKAGIRDFGRKLTGFDHPDAVMTGVETRSSAPLRILRDENYECSVKGLYPVGEGAGYAGGITSAAVDGLRAALSFAAREKGKI